MLLRSEVVAKKRMRGIKGAALAVSLVGSAVLTALALQSPHLGWLVWFSFLPIIVAIRMLRPGMAALAGGGWGVSLYLAFTAFGLPGFDGVDRAVGSGISVLHSSVGLFALLIAISAVYVGLAARPARAIGFKLLTLALGWTLVEFVVGLHNPSGRHNSLLTGSQGEGPDLHWLARLLGYVATAFLVACVNASLVGILSGARLSFPACRSLAGSPNAGAGPPSQGVPAILFLALRQAHPRAPPIQAAATNQEVGSAHLT